MAAAPTPSYYRMTLTEFAKRAFLGRPLSRNTLKALIDNRTWLGEKVGSTYLIFVDAAGQPVSGKPEPVAGMPSTGNAEADALIMEWNQSR